MLTMGHIAFVLADFKKRLEERKSANITAEQLQC